MLIDYGAKINVKRGFTEATALHYASCKGYSEVVKFLIEHDAKVNTKNSFRKIPLQLACRYGRLEVITLLMESAGADV